MTGRTRLPGFSGDWETTKLGEVASMGSGGTPLSSVPRYYGGGIPWVSISDMTRGGKYIAETETTLTKEGLASSAAKMYEPGVVLYAMYASLGECSLAVGRVTSSQAILGIKVGPRLDREFLYYWLQYLKP
ncbi:MAG: restriction endonuclease subunit S, partial [Actinobacteria bacterium]|nr:restriction endonuclease subunit S [Actinomycetota bacterium]